MQGTGTEADPYIITTAQELQEMKNDITAYYELGNDIDMSGFSWSTIQNFEGVLDGKGNEILNLEINDIDFISNQKGTIQNVCFSNVSAKGSIVGGLCYRNYGTIQNFSIKDAEINADSDVAGVCFDNNNIIKNCYFQGTLTAINGWSRLNGISTWNEGTIKKCYTVIEFPEIIIEQKPNGIHYLNDSQITDCYYNVDYVAEGGAGTALTTEEMKDQSSYENWDFEDTWVIDSEVNDGYPELQVMQTNLDCTITGINASNTIQTLTPIINSTKGMGTVNNPYQIWTAEDLNAIREDVTAYYIQMTDIDMDEYSWIPIKNFNGSFDGQEYKIMNFISDNGYGLFGATYDSVKFKNIILDNFTITDSNGTFDGWCSGALISECYNGTEICEFKNIKLTNSSIGDPTNTSDYVAGIGGFINGEIKDIYITNTEINGSYYTAGVISSINDNQTVEGIYIDNVTINSDYYGAGIIAEINNVGLSKCKIKDLTINTTEEYGGYHGGVFSYNITDVTINNIKIENVVINNGEYSAGVFSSTGSSFTTIIEDIAAINVQLNNVDNSGGFGYNLSSNSILKNCYAISSFINNNENFIAPFLYSAEGLVENCYYNSDTWGDYSQYEDSTATSLSTDEMNNIDSFTDWDFQNIWADPGLTKEDSPMLRAFLYNFSEGNGYSDNPFQLSTTEDYEGIRDWKGANFIQVNDIDFILYEDWEPIMEFGGVIDGDNYTVNNFICIKEENCGMFNYPLSTMRIKNMNFTNAEIGTYESDSVSLFVGVIDSNGSNKNGSPIFENCTLTDINLYSDCYNGLFIGRTSGINSSSQHLIIDNCDIINSNINSINGYCGAFSGGYWGPIKIKNCNVEDVTVNGGYSSAGFIGYTFISEDNISLIENCNFDITINTNDNYPGGLTGYTGFFNMDNCHGNIIVNNTKEIEGSTVDYIGGITGYVSGKSIITNCSINAEINGLSKYVGGITGFHNQGRIENCTTNIVINNNVEYGGGISGYSSLVDMINCESTAEIIGPDTVGGIAGMASEGTFENLNSNVLIKSNDKVPVYWAGGMFGYISNSSISKCIAEVDMQISEETMQLVSSNNDQVGGFIGFSHNNNINECCARGNVTGNSYIGGFIGQLNVRDEDYKETKNCYFKGTINGANKIGAFLGEGYKANIENCYAAANINKLQSNNNFTSLFIENIINILNDDSFIYIICNKNTYIYDNINFQLVANIEYESIRCGKSVCVDDYLYIVKEDASLYIYDKLNFNIINTIESIEGGETSYYDDILLWIDNDYLYVVYNEFTRIYDKTNFSLVTTLTDNQNKTTSIYSDSNYLYTGNQNGTVNIYNKTDFSVVTNIYTSSYWSTVHVIKSDDQHLYFTTSRSSSLHIYNKADFTEENTILIKPIAYELYIDSENIYLSYGDNLNYLNEIVIIKKDDYSIGTFYKTDNSKGKLIFCMDEEYMYIGGLSDGSFSVIDKNTKDMLKGTETISSFISIGKSNNILTNCYYDSDLFQKYNHNGDPFVPPHTDVTINNLSTSEMKQKENFNNWDFENIWFIDSEYNDGYPDLRLGRDIKTNEGPQITPISNIETYVNSIVQFNVIAEDPDGDELDIMVYGELSKYFDLETMKFRWQPEIYDTGFHKLIFEVSDGELTDQEIVYITVKEKEYVNNINVERRNARYKGSIESEKYNTDFNEKNYNIKSLINKTNDQNSKLKEKIVELFNEHLNIKRKIVSINDRINFYKEEE